MILIHIPYWIAVTIVLATSLLYSFHLLDEILMKSEGLAVCDCAKY
jgi:hypothetical protein